MLKTKGDSLSGMVDGPFGKRSISEGTIKGSEVYWVVKLPAPPDKASSGPLGMQTGELIEGMVRFVTDSFRPSRVESTSDDNLEDQAADLVIEFSAVIEDDDISGQIQFGPYATGTFKGSRSQS